MSAMEQHFTPQQVAEMWGLSEDTIRTIFADEPGVIRIGHLGLLGKRRRVSLRIPLSTLNRVYDERLTARLPEVKPSRRRVKQRLTGGDENGITTLSRADAFMAKEGL